MARDISTLSKRSIENRNKIAARMTSFRTWPEMVQAMQGGYQPTLSGSWEAWFFFLMLKVEGFKAHYLYNR